jgi:nascent polypeptide-associated complex subunit alpha
MLFSINLPSFLLTMVQILFVVNQPEVFKSAVSDMYIVLGEARIEDLNSQAQANAAQQFDQAVDVSAAPASEPVAKVVEDDSEESVDETGVEAKDIDLVMAQANCSRAAAVKALKAHQNDIVNAIMELSM